MNEEEQAPKVFFRVMLTTGCDITHEYDLPLDQEEAKDFLNEMAEAIVSAFAGEEPRVLYYQNPNVAYNADNVVAVRADFVNAEEYEEAIQRAMKQPLGFRKGG